MSDFELTLRIRDGRTIIKLKCPRCGEWGEIDRDQLGGRVSIHHDDPNCGYHETHDLRAHLTPPQEGTP